MDAVQSEEPDGERRLVLSEDVDAMHRALAALPDAEREVVLLRHFSQISFREIAEATEVPLGTALARGHRGLAKMRRLMEAAESDDDRAARSTVATAKG